MTSLQPAATLMETCTIAPAYDAYVTPLATHLIADDKYPTARVQATLFDGTWTATVKVRGNEYTEVFAVRSDRYATAFDRALAIALGIIVPLNGDIVLA